MRRAVWELSESCLGAVWDLCGAVWEKIEKTVQETLVWLDKNRLSEKDQFEAKLKEVYQARAILELPIVFLNSSQSPAVPGHLVTSRPPAVSGFHTLGVRRGSHRNGYHI